MFALFYYIMSQFPAKFSNCAMTSKVVSYMYLVSEKYNLYHPLHGYYGSFCVGWHSILAVCRKIELLTQNCSITSPTSALV